MYTFCRSELMYTKCLYAKCIPYFNKLLHTFCIQNVYKMFVYIQNQMYPTFQQTFVYILYTKFSWHRSLDFVYKMHTKACRNVVYILYNFCIQNVYTVSVWVLISSCNILKFFRRNLWFKNLYLIKRNLLFKNLYLIKPIQIEKSCHYH